MDILERHFEKVSVTMVGDSDKGPFGEVELTSPQTEQAKNIYDEISSSAGEHFNKGFLAVANSISCIFDGDDEASLRNQAISKLGLAPPA